MKKGEKVQLVGFGTFEVSERAAREGRNPQTGKTMKIEACKAPKFKAGKALKDAVNDIICRTIFEKWRSLKRAALYSYYGKGKSK